MPSGALVTMKLANTRLNQSKHVDHAFFEIFINFCWILMNRSKVLKVSGWVGCLVVDGWWQVVAVMPPQLLPCTTCTALNA